MTRLDKLNLRLNKDTNNVRYKWTMYDRSYALYDESLDELVTDDMTYIRAQFVTLGFILGRTTQG